MLTHTFVFTSLVVLSVAIAALFFVLSAGISRDHLRIASLEIDGLYLKLDKKLIIKASRIKLPESPENGRKINIEEQIRRALGVVSLFESVDIDSITVRGGDYRVHFADNLFYMVGDDFEVAIDKIRYAGKVLHANIPLVYIKGYDGRFHGSLDYNIAANDLRLEGEIGYRDLRALVAIHKERDTVRYRLKTNEFGAFVPLVEQLGLPPVLGGWLTRKVLARSYEIYRVEGAVELAGDEVRWGTEKIELDGILRDVTVKFAEKLESVRAPRAHLRIRNDDLNITLDAPTYMGKDLNGSTVAIVSLGNREKRGLALRLRGHTPVDEQIDRIIKNYGVDILVLQKSGSADAKVDIDLNFITRRAQVACDVNLTEAVVGLSGADIPIKGGRVLVEGHQVILEDIALAHPMLEGMLRGPIDLKEKKAKFSLDIGRLLLADGNREFVRIKGLKESIELDYNKGLEISLKKLNTRIGHAQSTRITLSNIASLKPYMGGFPVDVTGGRIAIETKDFAAYDFEGVIDRESCFLYRKSDSCLVKVPLKGSVRDGKLLLSAFGGALQYDSRLSQATLKGLNLDLKKFFTSHRGSGSRPQKGGFAINGTNSEFRYDKYRLLTDSYRLRVDSGENFNFSGKLGNDRVAIFSKGGRLTISAKDISDRMLHPLINFDGLRGGKYTLTLAGDPDRTMNGQVLIEGGSLRDFKGYNNLIALIDTIPSLAMLKAPGFSSKGYDIRKGRIDFRVTGDKIIFDEILIEGKSTNVAGSGEIDLKTRRIDIDLAILAAQRMGKLIGSIPLVGYILVGDDKSIAVGVKIAGTLDKPVSKTNPVKETLLIPLNILKRTLEVPKHLIESSRKPKSTKSKDLY